MLSLRADSFHPKSLIKFQRLRRICDMDTDFELLTKDMHHRFEQRGYNKTVLNKALARAKSLDRRPLLQKTPHEQQPSQVYFSTQYSTMAYDIRRIITKNWDILLSDSTLSAALPGSPAFTFRRAPTLRDSLVSSHRPPSKSTSLLSKPTRTYRCGSCNHCDNIAKTNTFMDIFSGKTFYSRSFANCNTLLSRGWSVSVAASTLVGQSGGCGTDLLNTRMQSELRTQPTPWQNTMRRQDTPVPAH